MDDRTVTKNHAGTDKADAHRDLTRDTRRVGIDKQCRDQAEHGRTPRHEGVSVQAGSVMVQSPFQANCGPQDNRERYSFKQ
jgi:hypothetical protein